MELQVDNKAHISSLALATLLVVSAMSVGSWAVLRNGVERQDEQLVRTGAAQVALVLQGALQTIQTQLRTIAFEASSTANSQSNFDEGAKALLTNPKASAAVIEINGQASKVVLAKGPDLHVGQALDPQLWAIAKSGSSQLSSATIRLGSNTYLALAAATTLDPNVVGLEITPLTPNKVAPNNSGPYKNYYIDLFNGPKPVPDQLLVSTYGSGPLPAPVGNSALKYGGVTWLVQAAEKTPLAGSYEEASPWVALGIGLLVALTLALAAETMARRNRYSERLVEQRTAELLEAQKVIVRNERLAAVGELATVVGHELRNPLGAVLNDLFLARRAWGTDIPAEVERHLSSVEREVNRATRLSEDLTAYMREREPEFSAVNVADLVADVLESTPAPRGVTVQVDASVVLEVDAALMTQVLTNLITNSYQAIEQGGGTVRVAASAEPPVITVQDSGRGFDPENADRLFDPFFTTKDEGTGLGLAIVSRLVATQGATVSIENVSPHGAKVSIEFPGRPS